MNTERSMNYMDEGLSIILEIIKEAGNIVLKYY
jgi:hypothetical protein